MIFCRPNVKEKQKVSIRNEFATEEKYVAVFKSYTTTDRKWSLVSHIVFSDEATSHVACSKINRRDYCIWIHRIGKRLAKSNSM